MLIGTEPKQADESLVGNLGFLLAVAAWIFTNFIALLKSRMEYMYSMWPHAIIPVRWI